MAVKGLTAKQKSALAEIVSSETLNDIEEYIKPQFPPKLAGKDLLISENNLPKANISLNPYSRRRIVQDGHGRWREVKPQLYSSNVQSGLRNKLASTGRRQHSLDSKDGSRTKCVNNRSHEHENTNYNNLSMALRSNMFPGLGNNQWYSTTAKVFTEQEIIPPHQRDRFFGMQTDEFGQWSAANVLHERMKKTWDTYIDTLPKQAANWKPQEQKEINPKFEKSPPQAKVKKANPKPKRQKKQASENEEKVKENPPSQTPIDIPNDDDDDDDAFWDFYDKPFNKPK